jgi:hypothetical protein
MEYQDATFFFDDGEAWEVKLPVCPECRAISTVECRISTWLISS